MKRVRQRVAEPLTLIKTPGRTDRSKEVVGKGRKEEEVYQEESRREETRRGFGMFSFLSSLVKTKFCPRPQRCLLGLLLVLVLPWPLMIRQIERWEKRWTFGCFASPP